MINITSFYNLGGIQTSFDDIKKFILKPLSKSLSKPLSTPINNTCKFEGSQLTFEYIDQKEKLKLPILYNLLIEKTSIDNYKVLQNIYILNFQIIKKYINY